MAELFVIAKPHAICVLVRDIVLAKFGTQLASFIRLAQMALRDECRAAIQFLCSDASCYMSGQNVVMDGGHSAW